MVRERKGTKWTNAAVRAAVGGAVAAVGAVAGLAGAVLGADSWSISIGVRETGSAGAIGSDGGTSRTLEWIDLDAKPINADNNWNPYTWNFGTAGISAFDAAGT